MVTDKPADSDPLIQTPPEIVTPDPTLMDRLVLFAGTGFGVGYSPIMPGTVGSLWGPPLLYFVKQMDLPTWGYWLLATVLAIIGIPICGRSASLMGRPDPGAVVYDEIVAFFIVFAFFPVTLKSAVIGFVCFRFFDILKPPPIGRLEVLHGGLGIMADDLLAGVYAALTMWGLSLFFTIT